MFSSEQVFKVSGDMDQLETAIRFAIDMYGIERGHEVSYQITKDGKYCLGWHSGDGWEKLPFDFDAHIVSEIVKQHLRKQDYDDPYDGFDGCTERGFLMKAIDQDLSDEKNGVKHPFYGIIRIEPFMNYYAK